MAVKNRLVIHAERLFDGERYRPESTVVIEGDTIAEVKRGAPRKADLSGTITPAIIDPHSHIGMFRHGEPGSEQEGNDTLDQFLPLNDAINSIYFDDLALRDAVDFGVLYSCILPGSGNLLGGRHRIIRTFGENRTSAIVGGYGYKMALGFNPRSVAGWKGDRPNTRMGLYSLIEKRFDEVLRRSAQAQLSRGKSEEEIGRQLKKKEITSAEAALRREFVSREYDLALSSEDRAILELLSGPHRSAPPLLTKVHVHKEDDVYYLIELKKRYGMRITAEHTMDVQRREVFEALDAAGIPIVYGPLGSHSYKVELRNALYTNAQALVSSGLQFGFMSDHPVIHVSLFFDTLKYLIAAGLSREHALATVTSINARMIGIGEQLGRIAEGYAASLLVWDGEPLMIGAMPTAVIGDGQLLRRRSR